MRMRHLSRATVLVAIGLSVLFVPRVLASLCWTDTYGPCPQSVYQPIWDNLTDGNIECQLTCSSNCDLKYHIVYVNPAAHICFQHAAPGYDHCDNDIGNPSSYCMTVDNCANDGHLGCESLFRCKKNGATYEARVSPDFGSEFPCS